MKRLIPHQNSAMNSRDQFYEIDQPIKTKCYVAFHHYFVLISLQSKDTEKYKDIFIGDFIEAISFLDTMRR
jgi:hypothetical protein